MRESLARAVNAGSLEWDELQVAEVDRVAALSAGSHLGSYLLRIREGAQPEWLHRAMLIISKRLHDKYRLARSVADAVATQSLIEWVRPHCRKCGGARELMGESIKIICPSCRGAGVHRWTDTERKAKIGAWGARIEQGLAFAQAEITREVGGTVGAARDRLGKKD